MHRLRVPVDGQLPARSTPVTSWPPRARPPQAAPRVIGRLGASVADRRRGLVRRATWSRRSVTESRAPRETISATSEPGRASAATTTDADHGLPARPGEQRQGDAHDGDDRPARCAPAARSSAAGIEQVERLGRDRHADRDEAGGRACSRDGAAHHRAPSLPNTHADDDPDGGPHDRARTGAGDIEVTGAGRAVVHDGGDHEARWRRPGCPANAALTWKARSSPGAPGRPRQRRQPRRRRRRAIQGAPRSASTPLTLRVAGVGAAPPAERDADAPPPQAASQASRRARAPIGGGCRPRATVGA